ncbi:hypothetical protein J7J18_03675 [bacterium]|nr:hypothetical protein [bacterium]
MLRYAINIERIAMSVIEKAVEFIAGSTGCLRREKLLLRYVLNAVILGKNRRNVLTVEVVGIK